LTRRNRQARAGAEARPDDSGTKPQQEDSRIRLHPQNAGARRRGGNGRAAGWPAVAVPICLLLAAAATAGADRTPLKESPLEAGYHQMYNLEFDRAHATFGAWKMEHPDDPLGPVSTAAAYLFAEFDRLHVLQSEFFMHDENFQGVHRALAPAPGTRALFYGEIDATQKIAAQRLASNPRDTTALFATILAMGLRSDYEGLIEKRNLSSLSLMKQSRQLSERLLSIDPSFYDAYLASGVENYMLSQKPMPLRWLLRLGGAQTDKEEGVRRVRITAEKGHYLQPFARLLMAVAALRDKDSATARNILRDLAREYPHNHLYSEELSRLP
jgi:hypothetical protein